MISWPAAFAITVVVETSVLFALFSSSSGSGRILLAALTANALTHPLVFLVLPRFFSSYGTYIIVAETFAFAAEVPLILLLLRTRPWYMAIAGSALANGASYLVGLIVIYSGSCRIA